MGIPPRFPHYQVPLHHAVATEQVFDGARKHMMNARFAIRRRGTLVKHKRRGARTHGQGARKEILGAPLCQHLLFDCIRTELGREQGKTRRVTLQTRVALVRCRWSVVAHKRSSTPRTTAASFGSAVRATLMMSSRFAGARASGKH